MERAERSPELLAELREAMATIDCLRDFVAEGARHMIGAAQAVVEADAQVDRIYTLIQKAERECAHHWTPTHTGVTYMDARCDLCGAFKRTTWD